MKNRPFLERLGFAFIGLSEAWRRERSFRTQVLIGSMTPIIVGIVGASSIWWAIISLTIALVLAAELFNAALEALIDHLHPHTHPEIRVAKDVAAAGVLLVSVGAMIVGLIFLYSKIWP